MMVRHHVPFAAGCWLLAAPVLGLTPALLVVGLPVAMLAGTLPDVDHPDSWIGHRLPGVSHLTRLVLGHRGGTHSLLAAALLLWGALRLWAHGPARGTPSLTASGLGHALALALVVGYLSHLVADACNTTGVPVFWPLRRHYRLPVLHWRAGNPVEALISWGSVALGGWLLVAPVVAR